MTGHTPDETGRRLDTKEIRRRLERRYSEVTPGNGPRYVLAPEVRNQAGFGGFAGDGRLRTCDLIVMDTWQSGPLRLIGHEIKASRSDWLRELKDPTKADGFRAVLAEWWLVVGDRSIVKDGELPDGWGLIAPAGNGLRAVVQAQRQPQGEIPLGLLSALMRSVYGLSLQRKPRPHTLGNLPMSTTRDKADADGVFAGMDVWEKRAKQRSQYGNREAS